MKAKTTYVYYRVKKGADNKLYRYGRGSGDLRCIAGELFTEKECEKYSLPEKNTGLRLRSEWLEKIELTRAQIVKSFGARFEIKDDKIIYG